MMPFQIEKIAKDFDISFNSACAMRVRYLFSVIDQWFLYFDESSNETPEPDIIDACSEICSIRIYQQQIKKGPVKQTITDEMIEAARSYPIENVVEFHKGVAIAFCHADKRPSLSWHKAKNKATCFPCGKSFNAVDVLMERDGLSFAEAVKQLSGGF